MEYWLKYQKKLSHSETGRHFIYITQGDIPFFPPASQKFTLQVNGWKTEVEVDGRNRIWLGRFGDRINLIFSSTIEITKNTDGVYILEQIT